MSVTAIFRASAIGSLACALLAVAVDFLPGLVPDNALLAVEANLNPGELFLPAIASLLVGITGLVATVGLVLFAHWSRPVAVAATVGSLALYPLTPAMVQSGWASLLLYLSAFGWGAALSMAYFSEIRQRFARGS